MKQVTLFFFHFPNWWEWRLEYGRRINNPHAGIRNFFFFFFSRSLQSCVCYLSGWLDLVVRRSGWGKKNYARFYGLVRCGNDNIGQLISVLEWTFRFTRFTLFSLSCTGRCCHGKMSSQATIRNDNTNSGRGSPPTMCLAGVWNFIFNTWPSSSSK